MSPSQIQFTNFSSGWIPSDDAINGRKTGLLKMDGVTLDENGALVMANGTKRFTTIYPANAHTMFSKNICGTKHRYVALVNGSVYRDDTSIIAAGSGSLVRAAFGVFGDFVLVASGKTLIKDACGGTVSSLELTPPSTAPLVNSLQAVLLSDTPAGTYANYVVEYGTLVPQTTSVQLLTSATNAGNRVASAHNSNSTDFPPLDLSGADDDILSFSMSLDDWTKFVHLQINFTMTTGELYRGHFYPSDIQGVNPTGALTLTKKRSEFVREGANAAYSWINISLLQIIIETKLSAAVASASFSAFKWYDSTQSPLNGTYTWVQVNVLKSGTYEVQSAISPESDTLTIANGSAEIIPEDPTIISPETTEIWIFRKGGNLPEYYRVIRQIVQGELAAVVDDTSDLDALNIGIILNVALLEINSTNLDSDIYEIVGPINGRMLFFTSTDLHFTPPNQPNTFDPALSIKVAGTEGEIFYWARKIGENTVLIGTSEDLYTLSGTFITLPDGTLDVYLKPIEVTKPPVCRDVEIYNGAVIYFVPFGWVKVSFTAGLQALTVPNTDLLYTGIVRYEYNGVPSIVSDEFRYSLAVSRDKIFCVVPVIIDYTNDASINDTVTVDYRLEVYDLNQKYWRPMNIKPLLLFAEEDGGILAFSADKRLSLIDYAHTKLINFVG